MSPLVVSTSVVCLSCHPCHLAFSFHPCHIPHFLYLVIYVIIVIPVIVVTLSLSVMSTATVDADLDLKAALTIVHDIGWPRPTCEDPEWFLERGLQQDIPIILFTKGLGLGHEGASFFVATKRSSAAMCIGRDGHDHVQEANVNPWSESPLLFFQLILGGVCKTQRIENGTWQWQCRGYDFGCASSLLLSGFARATAGSSP